jgi:endonuclease V-like protein UPF0215 family
MIRVLGIDDGHFVRGVDDSTLLFAVLMRGNVVEGASLRSITVDGLDATDAVIDILSSRFASQPRFVLLSASVFAGTNIVDLNRVYDETGIPIAAITRRPPTDAFVSALERSPRSEEKLEILRRNPSPVVIRTKRGALYVQVVGANPTTVKTIIEQYQLSSRSVLPEPLRLAHIFATAVTLGDSRGRP